MKKFISIFQLVPTFVFIATLLGFNSAALANNVITKPSPAFLYPLGCGASALGQINGSLRMALKAAATGGLQPYTYGWSGIGITAFTPNAQNQNPSATVAAAGSYSAVVECKDARGQRGLAKVNFVISPAQNAPRAASYYYGANYTNGTVWIYDSATNQPTGSIVVGRGPVAISISADGNRAYVANALSSTVSVIDTVSQSVIATIAVGTTPFDLAINPQGTKVFVANAGSNNISVIEVASNTVSTTFAVSGNPRSLVFPPYGTFLYVAQYAENKVSVVNTSNASGNSVVAVIPVGRGPAHLAISLDGTRLYTANTLDHTVTVVNTQTREVIGAPIAVGKGPYRLAVSPKSTSVYVANSYQSTVSVIHLPDRSVTTIPVGSSPKGITFNRDGSRVYVGNTYANNLSVIDTATQNVITAPSGAYPIDLAFYEAQPVSGTFAYVVNHDGTLGVLDVATNTLSAPISLGGVPLSVKISSDGAYAYIGLSSNQVMVLDTDTRFVVARIPVLSPRRMALSPDNQTLYVFSSVSSITVIDTATRGVTEPIDLPLPYYEQPRAVEVSPDGQWIYALSGGGEGIGGKIEVISTATHEVVGSREFTEGSPKKYNTPVSFAINPDGHFAYMLSTVSLEIPGSELLGSGPDEIFTLDLSTLDIIDVQLTGQTLGGRDLAVTPDGRSLLMTSTSSGAGIIMRNTEDLLGRWTIGNIAASEITITPDGLKAYVIVDDFRIARVNLITGRIETTIMTNPRFQATVGIALY